MTSAVGNRSTHAITTPTTRRSIQDLCSRGFLIAQPVFFAHITSYQTHTPVSDWAGPGFRVILAFYAGQATSLHISLQIYCQYSFLTILFSVFFLLFNFIQITRKKFLRFGFPGESLWLNLVVVVFLLLLRLLLLYLRLLLLLG